MKAQTVAQALGAVLLPVLVWLALQQDGAVGALLFVIALHVLLALPVLGVPRLSWRTSRSSQGALDWTRQAA